MCYWCMPKNSKCEWIKLVDFIKTYNSETGKQFVLKKCLDVFERSMPQPEILTEDKTQGEEMVVEHKIISWPPDHLQKHRAHHLFMETLAEDLRNEFQDDVYVIEVNAKDIEVAKKETLRIVREIAVLIRQNKSFILTNSGAKSKKPISWLVRRIRDYERDEEVVPDVGVGIVINEDVDFGMFSDLNMISVEKEVQKMLEKHLQQASKKFANFNNHIRVFVTEAYSSNALVDNELIEKVTEKINIPEGIDEIWVGLPRWVNENDYVPDYRRIK
jgi:hypothetical protein